MPLMKYRYDVKGKSYFIILINMNKRNNRCDIFSWEIKNKVFPR